MTAPLRPRSQTSLTAGPLSGCRIIVTRTREQASTLTGGLRQLGAEVIELPTIEIVPPASWQPLDDALLSLASYQWLVVTSANAVRAIAARLAVLSIDPAALQDIQIATVGPSTAAALRELGATPALIPRSYIAESLVDAIRPHICSGTRILLARAAAARDVVPDSLAALGASVDIVDAYRTVIPAQATLRVCELFAHSTPDTAPGTGPVPSVTLPAPDAATFTSSSTVKHFLAVLAEAGISRPAGLRAISIGPVTSATLRENDWEPAAEAVNYDVPGLIAATLLALRSR
ncbi:MAG TPA: uroporphyrinogen-III synthase [Acidisarcina sp.]